MADAYTKAYVERLDPEGRVEKRLEVQFNPAELSLSKGAQIAEIAIPGLDSPILQFVRGQNERLTLELFFDSTEGGTGAGAVPVTTLTNEFYALVKMSGREHAPPRCRFGWGQDFPGLVNQAGDVSGTRKAFECIVETIQQQFTLFSPDGVPLRATLAVTLREYLTLETQLHQLNLQTADHTRVHVVQRGETLPHIAYVAYHDPARWRLIADANRLLHPQELQPGTVLRLPPLRS
jgi:nucleoid-associated protein YgaU